MVPLKLKNRNFEEQVRLINGDCVEKDLGLSNEDKQILIEEVNYIIHCAATVRFDQELRTATRINVRAVRDLLVTAKQMKNLRVSSEEKYSTFHYVHGNLSDVISSLFKGTQVAYAIL